MPNQTKSKRIPVSLKPDLYSVISDLAESQKKPMSTVIVDLLEEMKPVLKATSIALAQIKKSNDPTAIAKEFGHSSILEVTELLGVMSKEIKEL